MAMVPCYFRLRQHLSLTVFMMAYSMVVRRVEADSGSCRYDSDWCSCRIGDMNQGVCWDVHPTLENVCVKRYCHPGWTCSCASRTHLCNVRTHATHKLINPSTDSTLSQASCTSSISLPTASSPNISLGSIQFHLSRPGISSDSCSQFAWWHNGELLGNYGKIENGIDLETSKRQKHSMIELKKGDLLAFRFIDASYYCYKHFTEFIINGTSLNSNAQSVNTMYAREYSADWYLPHYELNVANTGLDESETDFTKFLPLRTHLLTSGIRIVAGEDYWQVRDDTDDDHKRGDFYFRIQLLPDIM